MTSSGAALWRGRGPVQGSRKCQDSREGNSEMWLRMGGGNLREVGTWAGPWGEAEVCGRRSGLKMFWVEMMAWQDSEGRDGESGVSGGKSQAKLGTESD